jgi:hypothetical protein
LRPSSGQINSDTREPVDVTGTGETENNIYNTNMRLVPYSAFLRETCFAPHDTEKNATNQNNIVRSKFFSRNYLPL